jgi:cell division protein FtsW (lipid II flippase)
VTTARAATIGAPILTRRLKPLVKAQPVVARGGDPWIIAAVAMLVTVSIVMVFNTSYFFAGERFGDPMHVFRKHLVSIALGVAVAFAASRLRSSTYERLAYPALAIVVLMLIAVLIPGVGLVRGGARRWIGFGLMNLQPSEMAKLVAVLYLAHSMVRKGARLDTFALGVLPHVIVVGVLAALVVVEPDFGTAALLGVTLFAMLFAGGVRWWHLALPVLPIVPLAIYAISSSPYRLRRVMVFLDPWEHPRDAGFQLVQSFLAFGSGGLFGAGLGESKLRAARDARVARRASPSDDLRPAGRLRCDDDPRAPGRDQHGRRARPPPDEGPRLAVRELWRVRHDRGDGGGRRVARAFARSALRLPR